MTGFFTLYFLNQLLHLYFSCSYGAYKSLLERITVNDLALKGHLEGVELLILSSKVLPKEAQRMQMILESSFSSCMKYHTYIIVHHVAKM